MSRKGTVRLIVSFPVNLVPSLSLRAPPRVVGWWSAQFGGVITWPLISFALALIDVLEEFVTTSRFAVLGFGSSGARHAALLRQRFPEAAMLVYSSRVQELAGFSTTSSLDDVSKFLPDIVVVAGVATDRQRMVDSLPENLLGVLIEKPLADCHSTGLEVARALQNRSAVVQVGYNLRFSPSLGEFRNRVKKNRWGKLLGIRAETGQYLPDWRPGRDYRSTASAQAALGGGVLLELSHEIDYLRWIFGEVSSVSARIEKRSNLEIDVEDTAHLTLEFVSTHDNVGLLAQLNLDFVRHDQTRQVTALFEGGTLRWDGLSRTVEEHFAGTGFWNTVFSEGDAEQDTSVSQLDAFLLAAQGSQAPAVSLDDGLSVLQIIDSARASSLAGAVCVPVEPDSGSL